MNQQDVMNNLIVKCYGGSIAYGTNTPESDVDIRGIFYAKKESILTPFFPVREINLPDEQDGKLYELHNFMKLYCDMNPNILELLWVDRSSILETTDAYEHLRSYRRALLSKKVAFTFTGYATQQMRRIKGHNKWINSPKPIDPPVRADFMKLQHSFMEAGPTQRNFKLADFNHGYKLVPYGNDIYGLIESAGAETINKDGSIKKLEYDLYTEAEKKAFPLLIVKLCEDEYTKAKDDHRSYWEWKSNHNKTRSALEEKFGFDTKHAAHVVRLMRMGVEILSTGVVNVLRPDAQELLDIRNGKWAYEELVEWAEYHDDLVRNQLYKTTELPRTTDLKLAAQALIETQEICYAGKLLR